MMKVRDHNCTPIVQDQDLTHRISETDGYTVQNTRTVTTGSSNQVSIHAGFKVGILDFGGSDQLTVNTQVAIGDQTVVNHTETQDNTFLFHLHAPGMYDSIAMSAVTQYYVPVEYSGTALLEGNIADNMESINSVSQLLNESERSYMFAGIVTTTLIDAEVYPNAIVLTSQLCEGSNEPQVTISNSVTH